MKPARGWGELFKPTKGEEKVECETPTFPLSPGQMPTIESTASDEDNYKNKLLMGQQSWEEKHSPLASLPLTTPIIYHTPSTSTRVSTEPLDTVTKSSLQSQHSIPLLLPQRTLVFRYGSPVFKLDLESNHSQHTFKDIIQQWF